MSEDQNKTSEAPPTELEGPPEREAERRFLIRNSTRGRANRTLRATQPQRHSLRQYLAGGKYRIIRGRPITLGLSEIQAIMPELVAKVRSGALEICTPDGRLIDIETGEPMVDMAPSAPLPNPPLDSIANDQQNVGQSMPQFAGGDTETGDADVPALVANAQTSEPETPPAPPPPTPAAEDPPVAPPTETSTETTSVETEPPTDPSTETAEVPALIGVDMGASSDKTVTTEVEVAPPPAADPVKEEKKSSKREKNK